MLALPFLLLAVACNEAASASVVIDNDYLADAAPSLVVYRAFWQAVSFETPVPPGASSNPQSTVAASDNTAYVVLAPGWDPDAGTLPASLVLLQSRSGFSVHLGNTLRIAVDDATFAGNCAAGSFLTQAQADFIMDVVLGSWPEAGMFFGLHYDAATCTTTRDGEAGAQ
jgi:hypothetical protein